LGGEPLQVVPLVLGQPERADGLGIDAVAGVFAESAIGARSGVVSTTRRPVICE
jgi:hypothetical protein